MASFTMEMEVASEADGAFGDGAFGDFPFGGRVAGGVITPGVGAWTEIADVLGRYPVVIQAGISGSGGPLDRVGRPGSMSFALNNMANNSGLKQGYYSQGHADVRTGFGYGTRVRLKIDAGAGVIWYPFCGRLTQIAPTAGSKGSQETFCIAEDIMADLAEIDDLPLTLLESVTSDEPVQDLLDLLPTAPINTDLDVGVDVYPFVFDDLGGGRIQITRLLQDICQSELGYAYVRGNATDGETFRFENRHARALKALDATFAENEMRLVFDVPASLDRVFNDVEAITHPRRVDDAATTVLISLDAEIQVAAGVSETIFVDYRDPLQESAWIGGKDMVQPASVIDWTANDAAGGGGSDISADFTVVATFWGSRAKLVITNNGTVIGYLRGPAGAAGLQARGRGLRRYAPVHRRSPESGISASITDNGRRPVTINMPYQNSPEIGRGVAEFVENLWGNLANIPVRVRVRTGTLATLRKALVLDIGDRIRVSETMTAVDAVECFIQGKRIEIPAKSSIPIIEWTLAPSDTSELFILDDATAGVLDSSVLSYA